MEWRHGLYPVQTPSADTSGADVQLPLSEVHENMTWRNIYLYRETCVGEMDSLSSGGPFASNKYFYSQRYNVGEMESLHENLKYTVREMIRYEWNTGRKSDIVQRCCTIRHTLLSVYPNVILYVIFSTLFYVLYTIHCHSSNIFML